MTTEERLEKLKFYTTELNTLKQKVMKARQEYVAMENMFMAWVKEEIGDTSKENEQVHLADILSKWSSH